MNDAASFAHVRKIFEDAPFLSDLGIKLTNAGRGWCEAEMRPQPRHRQQHGFVHAGVVTTLADHTAGGAARSSLDDTNDVITIEFKINFLQAASGARLQSVGRTLRAGRRIVVAESEVYSLEDGGKQLVAKCVSTLAVIPVKAAAAKAADAV
ncbi:MAG TPA: PaaI family thioesterase [Terriglobales bacterium]|jgi:uncharacterized protein (TIGR00369 family)|nr:PaaI family thioesterase [Terriglobales bacterium]